MYVCMSVCMHVCTCVHGSAEGMGLTDAHSRDLATKVLSPHIGRDKQTTHSLENWLQMARLISTYSHETTKTVWTLETHP